MSKKIKLKQVKQGILSAAKGLAVSEHFIVALTGRKAHIFDKGLHLLHTIDQLYYVYHGYISPDESKILLVSTGNRFYVYSLENFECIQKNSLKGEWNRNIEGLGAWDYQDDIFLIKAGDFHCCVFYYSVNQTKPIEQVNFPDFWLVHLQRVESCQKHLLIGYHGENHKAYMIFLSGNCFEEYPIENFDEAVMDAEYNPFLDKFLIYGSQNAIICDQKGKFVRPAEVKRMVKDNAKSIKNWLDELPFSADQKEKLLDNLFDYIGQEQRTGFENINKLLWSKKLELLYVGTSERFFIYDREKKEVFYSKEIPFGVYDIIELEDNRIMLSTWQGVKIYEIVA